MKHLWITYVSTLFLLCVFVVTFEWFFDPLHLSQNQFVHSPLPDFLTILKNSEVSTIRLFQPAIENAKASEFKPSEISAQSALLYDLEFGTTLFSKNPTARLPMASLAKIMTAVVALEHKKDDEQYIVHLGDLVGEDSMGLSASEKLSLEELLYGLLLVSGNDAAEVFASNFEGGREKFINSMNQKAASLGLSDTHFTNPTGLQGDGDQYTTAHDLLVITQYALSNFPLFRTIVATSVYTITKTSSHGQYYLENETNLLTSYPGVKGVKTGYTPEAGLCLVTYLDYEGHQIIGIILGSSNRREEMKELLDYSLKTLGSSPPAHL